MFSFSSLNKGVKYVLSALDMFLKLSTGIQLATGTSWVFTIPYSDMHQKELDICGTSTWLSPLWIAYSYITFEWLNWKCNCNYPKHPQLITWIHCSFCKPFRICSLGTWLLPSFWLHASHKTVGDKILGSDSGIKLSYGTMKYMFPGAHRLLVLPIPFFPEGNPLEMPRLHCLSRPFLGNSLAQTPQTFLFSLSLSNYSVHP